MASKFRTKAKRDAYLERLKEPPPAPNKLPVHTQVGWPIHLVRDTANGENLYGRVLWELRLGNMVLESGWYKPKTRPEYVFKDLISRTAYLGVQNEKQDDDRY